MAPVARQVARNIVQCDSAVKRSRILVDSGNSFVICQLRCVRFVLVGKDRHLCSVDHKQLISRSRQTNSPVPLTPLATQAIEKITNCHLFAVGQVCAAFYVPSETRAITSPVDIRLV